jgi:hypothetical protein
MPLITIEVGQIAYELLQVLATGAEAPDYIKVEAVVLQLIDHAQQGVYRPGSWERPWLCQAFGDDWTKRMEPGDPYGKGTGQAGYMPFERPKRSRGRGRKD